MDTLFIPKPDVIPVAWGWFQFLLLLTLPLHLMAMNAMVGSLGLGVVQHIRGGDVQSRLAHRIALALPLVIATVVNLGVAPFLFMQVLYGQFNYTSSILMGTFWILVIPMLIVAYYGAYLYDFKFEQLGKAGILIGIVSLVLFLTIGAFFSNNMLLMTLPERFGEYFANMGGTLLIFNHPEYLPRYLHMMMGALAVGGLYVALLGRFKGERDFQLMEHAENLGMRVFFVCTLINAVVGLVHLGTLPKKDMMIFMGGDIAATIVFSVALLLTVAVLVVSWKKKLWLTVGHVVVLVYLMVFTRAWLRSSSLREFFTLDQLEVVPQYSPLVFFIVTLVIGIAALVWLWQKTSKAMTHL
jgi:hypothetical protein